MLALIMGSNELVLVNINDSKHLLLAKQDNVYVLDSRIASPYFRRFGGISYIGWKVSDRG